MTFRNRLLRVAMTLMLALMPATSTLANPTHQKLTGMSEQDRARAMAAFLRKSGESCDVATRTFYQGSEKNGNAHWAIECKNGRSYMVQVINDAQGSTSFGLQGTQGDRIGMH